MRDQGCSCHFLIDKGAHYSLCLDCTNNVVFAENIFSFWDSRILLVLFWSAPIKISGIESFTGFPRQKYHTQNVTFLLLWEEWALCGSSRRERAQNINIYTWTPPKAVWVFFPHNPAMNPYYFAIIIATSTIMCWVLWILLANLKAGVVLQTPNTIWPSGKRKIMLI